MISLYFGIPGCGKTTVAVYFIMLEQEKINRGVSPYKQIVTNIDCKIPNVKYCEDFTWVGKYRVTNTLVVVDESLVDFNSRKYKFFSDAWVYGFTQHRHYYQDWMFFSQRYDGLDLIIRSLTEKVYFIHKGKMNRCVTYVTPVKFTIQIPKTLDSDTFNDIRQGHCQAHWIERLFQLKLPRDLIYPYFDSFIETKLLPEPPEELFRTLPLDRSTA